MRHQDLLIYEKKLYFPLDGQPPIEDKVLLFQVVGFRLCALHSEAGFETTPRSCFSVRTFYSLQSRIFSLDCAFSGAQFSAKCVGQRDSPALIESMPRPRNSVLRSRAAILKRWSNAGHLNQNDMACQDSPKESSDDDVYLNETDSEITENALDQAQNLILKWKSGAKPKRPASYQKDSRTTKWRRSKMMAERVASVSDCHRITDFLPKAQKPIEIEENSGEISDISSSEDEGNDPPSLCSIDDALAAVNAFCSVSVNRDLERRLKALSKYDYVRYMSLCRFFQLVKNGKRSVEASLDAANLFPDKSPRYQAKNDSQMGPSFLKNSILTRTPSRQAH